LSGTKVTDAGLAGLEGATQLKTLRLDNTAVRGPGLESLKKLPALRTLALSSTPIDDDSLKHLAVATQVQTLYVQNTPITDAGIESLKALKELKFLSLTDTAVSNDGVADLLKSVPGVIIPTRAVGRKSDTK